MGKNEDDSRTKAREALIPWRAKLMVDIFGGDASRQARRWADRLLAQGDVEGAAAWQPIIQAIDELQRAAPREGEARCIDGRVSRSSRASGPVIVKKI